MSAATSTAAEPVARQLGRGNALRAKTKSASVRAPVRARAARAEILQFAPAVGEDGIRVFCLSRGLGDVYKRQGWRRVQLAREAVGRNG